MQEVLCISSNGEDVPVTPAHRKGVCPEIQQMTPDSRRVVMTTPRTARQKTHRRFHPVHAKGSQSAAWKLLRTKESPARHDSVRGFECGAGEMNRTPDLLITNDWGDMF
ncbi:MAG: hypothetical protein QUV35_17315 [Hydrogenophaga sp.]|uniref:hypothetical protein n=1 Tax=Hydrogenophaga sp. TaxID=1904254 RepID=UPI00262B6C8E|nr:hypothetical protein [Hydrogenophaga sp.]MDM7944383.1 hypothetical protein [Hydrogenophaga sp.]